MRHLTLYIFLIFVAFSGAQNRNKLDSLLKIKRSSNEDTASVKHYINLCYAYKKVNPDSALYWVNKAISIAKKLKNEKFIIQAIHSKGYHYKSIGDNQIALDTTLYAYNLSKASEKKTNLVGICQDLGLIYRILGNFDKSVIYYQEALKQSELTKNKKGIYNSYNSLANTYCQMGMSKKAFHDLERALQFYDKAFQYADSTNKAVIAMIKSNSGVALFNMGIQKKDSSLLLKAKDFYMQSLSYRSALYDSVGMSQSYGNIAGAYHELCNIKPNEGYLRIAKRYYELGIDMGTKMGSNGVYHDIINYGAHLGLMATLKKDKVLGKMAIDNLKKALVEAEKFGDIMNVMAAHGSLSNIYQNLGMHEEANLHLNEFVHLKDTILSQENKQIAEELAMKYESDLKEKENNNLKDQAALREEVISRKSTQINLMIAGSALLIGLIVLVFISRQKINKAKQLTEKQKHIIEDKNKEIIDSINYAKRLQDAAIPSPEYFHSLLPNSFIYYNPKDIVAGDFYWIYQLKEKNKLLVAAADCTGHGVPGALVSIVCLNALNRCVDEFKLSEPAKILDKTTEIIQQSFRLEENDVKDGMDIGLVLLDLDKNEGMFSGANNPLWLLTNGTLNEIKGDSQPVGKQHKPQPFTQHEFKFKKDDLLILFTDGYADQFGGSNGKKLKSKAFKAQIANYSTAISSEIKQNIEDVFVKWKGSHEQVDDVLIIGIRL